MQDPRAMWHARPSPPPISHTHSHPPGSQTDPSSRPADLSSPLIQTNATGSLHSTTRCLTCATATRKQTQSSSPRQGAPPNPWCWELDRHRHGGERGSNPQCTPTSLTGLSWAAANPLGSTLLESTDKKKPKPKKPKPALSARIFRGGWAYQKLSIQLEISWKQLDFMCAIALLKLVFKAGKHIIEKPKRLLWLSGGVGVNAKQHSEL